MSDREGTSGLPPGDDDLSLPKATVAKMIAGTSIFCHFTKNIVLTSGATDLLPNDVACAKETRDLVIECCVGENES
jgi:hypothetical protein